MKEKHGGLKITYTIISLVLAVVLGISPTFTSLFVSAKGSGTEIAEQVDMDADGDNKSESIVLGLSYNEGDFSDIVKVSSEEDLLALAKRVNDGDGMSGALVVVEKDITVTADSWEPIGNTLTGPFSGKFYGSDKKINGIVVFGESKGGLFGYLLNAEITNVILDNPRTKNSTSGLFYSAVSSTIKDCSLTYGTLVKPISRGISTFAAGWDDWDGALGDPAGATALIAKISGEVLEIDSAMDLANLAYAVNFGLDPNSFKGIEVNLTTNLDLKNKIWAPIGIAEYIDTFFQGIDSYNGYAKKAFRGTFNGNNNTIKNMYVDAKQIAETTGVLNGTLVTTPFTLGSSGVNTQIGYAGGLFGVIIDGGVANLIIDNAKAEGHVAGPVAANVYGGAISNITVFDSTVGNATDSLISGGILAGGGITGISLSEVELYPSLASQFEAPTSHTFTIRDCAVINSTITSYEGAGGIVRGATALLINGCAVYGSVINAPAAGGIIAFGGAQNAASGAYSQNVVMNTKLIGTTLGGVAGNPYDYFGIYSTVSDNIITRVELPAGVGYLTADKFPTPTHYGIDKFRGVMRNINDDTKAEMGFDDKLCFANYRDSIFTGADGLNPDYLNALLSTTTMTNSSWSPGSLFWYTKEYFYPQPRKLTDNSNEFVKAIADLAVTVPVPEREGESYEFASRLTLPNKSWSGKDIGWDIPVSSFIKEDGAYWNKYHLEEGGQVHMNTVTATIDFPAGTTISAGNKLKKVFENVNVYDSVLLIEKTIPTNGAEIDITDKIQIIFKEQVLANNAMPQTAILQVNRSPRGAAPTWVTEQSIACADSGIHGDANFQIGADGKTVTLNFEIRQGVEYKLIFKDYSVLERNVPAGVMNYNTENEISFSTAVHNAPYIEILEGSLSLYNDKTITEGDVLSKFKVWETKGGAIMYDGATGVIPTKNTEPWDDEDPWGSADIVLGKMSNGTIKYHIDTKDLFGANPPAGSFRMYIMAKNRFGLTAVDIISINVVAVPKWIKKPLDIVHIPWTDNLDAVKAAARQDSSATAPLADGSEYPCNVEVEIDKNVWEDNISYEGGPFSFVAEVYPLDTTGKKVPSLVVKVMIYLDRPLFWTMTQSPVTMGLTTKRQVEEAINFTARNFKSGDVIYDHYTENYRRPGTYFVEMDSKPQHVTRCTNVNCVSIGKHPPDRVNDVFIINLIYTPGPEITSSWGKMSAEALAGGENYSQNIIRLEPTSYFMPSFVPKTMSEQDYSTMQLSYFDRYRWNLYSDSLNLETKWSEVYNLEATMVKDENVAKLLGTANDKALQLQFGHEGPLFGTVELEWNLSKLEKTTLPKADLGLYRYNLIKDELELMSDVIITKDGWASSVLEEIYPTTYVLKARNTNDQVVAANSVKLKEYYELVKVKDKKTGMLVDVTKEDLKQRRLAYQELLAEGQVEKIDSKLTIVIVVAILVIAVAAGGYSLKRKGRI